MLIEHNSVDNNNTIVKIDTDSKIILLHNDTSIEQINETIPFEKISYLILKLGHEIGKQNYIEFYTKNKIKFSIPIEQKQIEELEKFFNIRKEVLIETEKIIKNQKYWLLVAEPWDYTHPVYGNNRILGNVLDVNNERVIFKTDNDIELSNEKGNILILQSRFRESCSELPLHINGSILFDYDSSKTDEELLANSKFVIIGRLEKSS